MNVSINCLVEFPKIHKLMQKFNSHVVIFSLQQLKSNNINFKEDLISLPASKSVKRQM